MLKKIFSFITLLILGALIYAYFAPKDYEINSKTTINLPADSVFNYIKLLKNEKNYSKWVQQDPNSKLDYIGTDGTVGFKNTWNSSLDDVGAGEQVITKLENIAGGAKTLTRELKFIKPFKGKGTSTVKVIPLNNGCEVTFNLKSSAAWPLNLLIPIIKKGLQNDMNVNCSNLKNLLGNVGKV